MPCAHQKHDNVDGIVRNEPWVDYEREFIKVCHCERCVRHGFAVELMDILRKHFAGTTMQLVASPSPGTCVNGNSIIINDQVAVLKDMDAITNRVEKELERQRKEREEHPELQKETIKVCFGPTCGVKNAQKIEENLWKNYHDDNGVRIMRCGCTGNCIKSNNVVVNGNIISRQSPLRVVNNVELERSKQRREAARNSGPLSMDEAEEILSLGNW